MKITTLTIAGCGALTALLCSLGCSAERKARAAAPVSIAGSAVPAPGHLDTVAATPALDARATAALTQMAQTLGQAQTLTFSALTTTEDVSSTLQKLQFDTSVQGTVKRPDKLYLEKTGAENVTLWFDGTTATILDRTANTYLSVSVSGGIDGLMDELETLSVEAPFGGLLRSDLDKATAHVASADYYGPSPVDGVSCHHLALRQDNVDWQIWIDENTNTPKKAVITSKMLAAAPEHQIFVKDLTLDSKVDDSMFQAVLPKGAQQAQAGK